MSGYQHCKKCLFDTTIPPKKTPGDHFLCLLRLFYSGASLNKLKHCKREPTLDQPKFFFGGDPGILDLTSGDPP